MRRYPKSNSDIKTTMDVIVNKFRNKGIIDSILILKYVGSILYLEKVGLGLSYEKNDCDFDLTLSDAPQIDKSSAIYPILENNIKQMESILGNAMHQDIVGMLLVSFYDVDEYLEWFDYLIDIMPTIKGSTEYITPDWLSVLADAFICFGEKSVFCPFGGAMKLSTDMNFYEYMYAYEINTSVWELGMIRLALSNDSRKVSFENKLTELWKSQKYDAIVSFPPLGMRYPKNTEGVSGSFRIEDSDLKAASLFMDITTDKGVCFSIVTPSLLYNQGEKAKFRKWAVEQGIIDTVILLPSKLLPYTGIALALVVLRKQPKHENAIRMIDASGYYTNHKYQNQLEITDVMNAYLHDVDHISRTVSYDEIAENDYSWHVPYYMHIPEDTVQEGYKNERIEDLVLPFSDSHLNNPQKGKVIKVSDLSDDWTQCTLDISKLSEEESNRNMTLLNQKAVVVSTVRSVKPTIVNASEETPVLLSPNVFALILKDTIDPEYFCMTLAQSTIPATGMAIPHISRTSILRCKISYPDISLQKDIYKEARKTALIAKAKETGLQDIIDQMKGDYINEIRSRKHDMMPHLRQVSSACKNLNFYMTHKGDMPENEFMEGIKEEVENQKRAVESLTTLLKVFSREEEFGTPEIINIDKFLREHYHSGKNYQLYHETDGLALLESGFDIPHAIIGDDGYVDFNNVPKNGYLEGINVYMAPDDLMRLCDNIINNAVGHGFTDPSRNDYVIDIILSVDGDSGFYYIDFSNNGTPFPKGFDKTRYGIRGEKAGETAGSGEGGHTVKSIVEHYGGHFEIFSNEGGGSDIILDEDGNFHDVEVEANTTVRIYLPIYKSDE